MRDTLIYRQVTPELKQAYQSDPFGIRTKTEGHF
jgi:hypothetical protein